MARDGRDRATLDLFDAVYPGRKPQPIDGISFEGAGLKATGTIALQEGGGLNEARFDRVQLDDWLDANITLEGRGQGKAVGVSIESGKVDLRRLAVKRSGVSDGQDGPMTVQLDRLTVSDGIALTNFGGEFSSNGGFNGSFSANVNGQVPVEGTVAPSAQGTAVRITSKDAGGVMAAAGIFATRWRDRVDGAAPGLADEPGRR